MFRYFFIAITSYYIIHCSLLGQESPIKINSVTIAGNYSIPQKELMPLLRQRPSNFSFTFKGTSFNNRLLKIMAFKLVVMTVSKCTILIFNYKLIPPKTYNRSKYCLNVNINMWQISI